MVNIKLHNGKIELSSDIKIENEDDLLKELTRVLCFVIIVYKRRLEKLQKKNLTELTELIVNQKIRDSIVIIPINEVRKYINETNLS